MNSNNKKVKMISKESMKHLRGGAAVNMLLFPNGASQGIQVAVDEAAVTHLEQNVGGIRI